MEHYERMKTDSANSYFLFSRGEIEAVKARIGARQLAAYKNDMETLFDAPLESVTSKTKPAPSGCPNDYVSLATYWWADPERSGGLPYLRKDGFVNPEGKLYDKDKLKRLAYLVNNGSMLWFLTGEKRYVELIRRHLRNWFINPETRMNPHLEYGQFIPGVCSGRGEGIIDYSASFPYALNMLSLLRTENMLDADTVKGLEDWHRAFRSWLLESPVGIDERSAQNNHGVYYDLALCVIEMFLGMEDEVKKRGEAFGKERLEKQIAGDFSLPRETGRTRSVNYCLMALKGFLELAKIYRSFGRDWFPGLKGTVDWAYGNLVLGRKNWPHAQVTQIDEGIFLVFREMAVCAYGGKYLNIADFVDREKIAYKVLEYLYLY